MPSVRRLCALNQHACHAPLRLLHNRRPHPVCSGLLRSHRTHSHTVLTPRNLQSHCAHPDKPAAAPRQPGALSRGRGTISTALPVAPPSVVPTRLCRGDHPRRHVAAEGLNPRAQPDGTQVRTPPSTLLGPDRIFQNRHPPRQRPVSRVFFGIQATEEDQVRRRKPRLARLRPSVTGVLAEERTADLAPSCPQKSALPPEITGRAHSCRAGGGLPCRWSSRAPAPGGRLCPFPSSCSALRGPGPCSAAGPASAPSLTGSPLSPLTPLP